MGIAIDRQSFTTQDVKAFNERLEKNLLVLRKMLQDPKFGAIAEQRHIGSEVELYLVDEQTHPAHCNQSIQTRLNDERITLELNRFNLEFNATPVALSAKPLTEMAAELNDALAQINVAAAVHGCSALPIGILPTIRQNDFGPHAMTDLPRYHALTQQLRTLRGGPFRVHIEGRDQLDVSMEDVTLEGANTSLQLHFQVTPSEFADYFNALQLVTPLLVAFAANSPIAFGRCLWHETRIPLFKQAIDCRPYNPQHPVPARVNFGHAWVREGAYEIFAEAVRLYRPLLPVCSNEDSLEMYASGKVPGLDELRLQQGSVWLWNRPVYDPSNGGHLRIEARSLPAGPSVVDMMANIVLTLGLMELMKGDIAGLLCAMPFEYCERNFYRAAQLGLDAEISWPDIHQHEPGYRSCRSLLQSLLPQLPAALNRLGLASSEYDPYLDLIEYRLSRGQTGAVWQLSAYQSLSRRHSASKALESMVLAYQTHSQNNLPVAQWPLPTE